jgi:hypothetical protein
MQLNAISISPKSVIMSVSANKETDEDINDTVESKITAKEEPLPTLTKAWDGLKAVFVNILELPDDYVDGLTITKLSIRRTKAGTRSVTMEATKQLECRQSFLHTLTTPCVQIEPSADGESGAVEIEKKLAAAVMKAIHESERYMEGDRSQQLLDFDKAKAGLQAVADLGKDDKQAALL